MWRHGVASTAAVIGQEPVHVRGGRRGDGVSAPALAHLLLSLLGFQLTSGWREQSLMHVPSILQTDSSGHEKVSFV